MNNPFDYSPDPECEAAFLQLTLRIGSLKSSGRPEDLNFCRELEEGKMLGVLIAADELGGHHTLFAFSGQIGDQGFHHAGFVAPAFDYLSPDGYFKTNERKISLLNKEIDKFTEGEFAKAKTELSQAKEKYGAKVEAFRERCRLSKQSRAARRASGEADQEEMEAMLRQSQFEKAELHRLKKRIAIQLAPFEEKLRSAQAHLDSLKERRHNESEQLQTWLFENFRLLNYKGESKSLKEIFRECNPPVPPSGAGECCAPKLLQAAYLRGWQPLHMAEYWYGKPKGGEIRRHGEFYPACRGKCLPVLTWMLQGLDIDPPLSENTDTAESFNPEIIYENEWFCVVDKPSGMLSVPGKVNSLSLQEWLEKRYGADKSVRMAHRLDQDTSGLIIATFGDLPFRIMQTLFATRRVSKTYVAELEGDFEAASLPKSGRIELPLSPDWLDRPRQRVDFKRGKEAVTDYEFIGTEGGRSLIEFHPLTGRTHQLRVHASSGEGLGLPIVGDRLYGRNGGRDADRLHLHAHRLAFTFPLDNRHYSFESPVPFL